MHQLGQDVRFGFRLLVRSPGSSLAAVVCLAIGIGVTTIMMSSLQSNVFRFLPAVNDPGELVRFQTPLPFDNYEEFRDHSGQFSSIAAFMGPVPFVLTSTGGDRERIWGNLATPDYFQVMEVRPAAGRLFGPEESREGSGQVAVISTRLWRGRFGGGEEAIGQTIRLNGQSVTLIGVAAEGFFGASPTTAAADLWVPTTASVSLAPELGHLRERHIARFDMIGRLQPGLALEQAEAALETVTRRLEQIHNDPGKDRNERRVQLLPGGRLFPIRDQDLPAALGLPLVLAGLVLLMACGNVANMLIARGTSRRSEIAIRLSIGAGRGRLIRQLLTESVLLAGLGCLAAALLTRWVMSFYASLMPMFPGYVVLDWQFDWRALAIAVAAALAASVMSGLAPALQATRADIASSLKPAAPSGLRARRGFSLRNIVIAQQVAASVVLLLLTGFIVLGFSRASSVDLGFQLDNLYLLSVDPVRDGYDRKQAIDYFEKLPEWAASRPGVTSASLAETLPVAFAPGESLMSTKVEIAGGPRSTGALRSDRVGAGFFQTTGIPILRGRGIEQRDVASEARVAVVNETMAQQFWPGENAIGQTVDLEGVRFEVVGIAGNIRSALPLKPPEPAVYRPVTPSTYTAPPAQGITLLVRMQPGIGDSEQLRRDVAAFDSNVTVFNVRRMEDVIGQALYLVNMITTVYGSVGIFALVLAAAGLGGVTAYSVARRGHEMAIRMALGANKGNVLRLILREAGVITAVGTLVGLVLAVATMRVLSSILNTIAEGTRSSISDPLLLVGVPAVLVGLALLASYLPARRATRIDPVAALKAE